MLGSRSGANFGIVRTTSNFTHSSAVSNFESPYELAARNDRNFKFTALGPANRAVIRPWRHGPSAPSRSRGLKSCSVLQISLVRHTSVISNETSWTATSACSRPTTTVRDMTAWSPVYTRLMRAGDLTILLDTCGGNHKDRPWTHRFHQLDTPGSSACARRAPRPRISMWCSAPISTPTTSDGTPCCATAAGCPTFPNAKYLFSRADDVYWDMRKNPVICYLRHAAYEDSVLPVVEAGQAVLIDDGYDVTSRLSVEAAPGHSPGHVQFRLADEGKRAVFCGDVIHHALQVYAPHWNHMADECPADAALSRRRLLSSCDRRILAAVSDSLRRAARRSHRIRREGLLGPVRA